MTARLHTLLLLLVALCASVVHAAQPVRVMILDGESNPWHDWKAATPALQRMLDETGLFEVEVITAPPAGADFSVFRPDFDRYAAVVLNYDAPDGRWPAPLMAAFERYMREGGGLVVLHAADNAFPAWLAFNEMTGIGGWRDRGPAAGPYWYLRDGSLVSDAAPGPTGSHGRRLPFRITVRKDHPVTAGLPPVWTHAGDELYAHLRGPGRNMTVLATAWSDPANAGSGRDEPQLMVLDYGKGRVFHSTLGHDLAAMSAVDFVVTFQRGTEWVATGKVTQPVPADFPGPEAPRQRADLQSLQADR
ncbi:MAG TPA: ThuA domain-containing protein [Steroidobacteraceae bacterium]|nr:ThuA domain-containing protein [Steroidobacteraceae bacterium]